MRQLFVLVAGLSFAINANAQKQRFGIVSYAQPKGWNEELKESVKGLSFIDKKDRSWCQVGIYKSTASKGSIDLDFQAEWNQLIDAFFHTGEPSQTTDMPDTDGWKIRAGSGNFVFNGNPAAAMLATYSGYGVCVSIVATTSNDRYIQDIESLIGSVELAKPEQNNTTPVNMLPATGVVPVQDGFTFTTSNFDDGWTSTIQTDWVQVSKGGITVYLWYALPFDADNFTGTGVMERDYYWDNYVTKYFTIQTKQYRDDGEVVSGLKPKYVEGWGADKQTGERKFIAMTLAIAPNTAYLTIATAADEETIRKQFPKANDKYTPDLTAMSRYNKFAIGPDDITGQWQSGSSNALQWYYSSSSGYEGYAGTTVAAISATFNFNKEGSYSSIHNGATGKVGNLSTFQQEYKGKYTVSNWVVTATNRWKGKTDKFDASFMAVRGGRVLKLNGGAGMEYSLVKVK